MNLVVERAAENSQLRMPRPGMVERMRVHPSCEYHLLCQHVRHGIGEFVAAEYAGGRDYEKTLQTLSETMAKRYLLDAGDRTGKGT